MSFTSIPCKVTDKIFLKTILNHMKDKKVTGSRHYGFSKGKSCLTNLIAFYNEVTGLEDEGRAVDVAYLDFLTLSPITSS